MSNPSPLPSARVRVELGDQVAEFELSPAAVLWLEALSRGSLFPLEGNPAEVLGGMLEHLASSAADGARRPGAWERGWIRQAFGLELEPLALVACDHAEPGPVCPRCHVLRRYLPAEVTA